VNVAELGPFDEVLDVGGNVGSFADLCRCEWPAARVTSFEPLPGAAKANRQRAGGRWLVVKTAVGDHAGIATLHYCLNQHSASSLHEVGPVRRDRFGIRDRFEDVSVSIDTLDRLAPPPPRPGRLLVKIDVEGHELHVLRGAVDTLARTAVCVVELNQAPCFQGAPPVQVVDDELRQHGLCFAGIVGVQLDPLGEPVQFDGVWARSSGAR
jgi:FkbM family methyltransferase